MSQKANLKKRWLAHRGTGRLRFSRLLRPYFPHLALTLTLLAGLALVNMAVPAIIGVLFNNVFQNENWSLLYLLLGAILIVYLLRNLLYWAAKVTSVYIGENLSFELRKSIFERLQRQNLRFYKGRNPGELSSRVMDDSFVIQGFVQDDLPTLIQSATLFLGLAVVTYSINWQLALAATIVLPLHLAVFRYFHGPIRRTSRQAQQHLAEAHGTLIERFLAMEVVKGFTAEDRENAAFVRAINSSRASQSASKRIHVTQKVVADLLVGVGTISLLGFGGYQVMKGGPDAMLPGTFIAFFGYVGMLYPTVVELVSGSAKATRASSSVERVGEVLRSQRNEDRSAKPIVVPIQGALTFEDIDVCFEDGFRALKDISFEVPAGSVCVVMGPSGAGKSTLLGLVPRFIEPTYGRLLIDGIDAERFKTQHLRQSVGIAFQEAFLFNATVLENLRYANPDATMWQIINTARLTGTHDLVTSLPHGYHTMLGEDGVNLSRGEKQRIVLTRALLKNPQILLLDEATASIDVTSEATIIPAVLEHMRGRTVLMVTHNPELISYADMTVRLDSGTVTYAGQPTGARKSSGMQRILGQSLSAIAIAVAATLFGLLATPAAAQSASNNASLNPFYLDPNGGFYPQAGLAEPALTELIDVLTTQARTQLGYSPADEAAAAKLPQPPTQLNAVTTLAKPEGNATRLLQIGHKLYQSQPPHVWIAGALVSGDQSQVNPDVIRLTQILRQSRQEIITSPTEVRTRTIQLSYVESDHALQLLKTLGYNVMEAGAVVDPAKLPAVMKMPETTNTGLVGGSNASNNQFGISLTPGVADKIENQTSSGPLMQLLAFYHPAHPEQLSRMIQTINTTIDLPARQLLIEAMVLEISKQGLEKLGIEWELESPSGNLSAFRFGTLPDFDTGESPTLDADFRNIFGEFTVRLEALVRDQQAEILSRPSILTLDGRQASIRVGDEIPIATSFAGVRGGDTVKLDFKYIPVGILLNVRPRITADGEEISLQIDGVVSAEVPGEDLIIFDNDGDVLGRAPQISTRRVQTHTRIGNNTPFIIGGLVAKNNVLQEDKVPILGDLPLINPLFKTTKINNLKQEVIIVITPFVLPEQSIVGRNLPEDKDTFDSFGNELFRDAYRIRAEDVFDLSFILNNSQLQTMQRLADRVASQDIALAETYPFNQFINKRIPGEGIFVYRQIYEVIKRLSIHEKLGDDRMIFFAPDESSSAGFSVTFLDRYLQQATGVSDAALTAAKTPAARINLMLTELQKQEKAIAQIYTQLQDDAVRAALSQPVPEIRLVDCADSTQWGRILWELNQSGPDGRQRHTILLHSPSDLTRLKRSLILDQTVKLNGHETSLTLGNFTVGRQLLIPSVKPEKIYLIDSETARYFFLTEHYYPAFSQKLAEEIENLINAIDQWGGQLPPELDPRTPGAANGTLRSYRTGVDTDRQAGVLRIGMAPSSPPITFLQDGVDTGLEAAFAEALGHELGRRVEIVSMFFPNLLFELRNRRIDIAMAGITITPERQTQIAFTAPYLQTGIQAMIRTADAAALPDTAAILATDRRVAVDQGTTSEAFARTSMPDATIVTVPTIDSALNALRNNQVDIILNDAPLLHNLTTQPENENLAIVPGFLTSDSLAWAIHPEDKQLLEQLNATLNRWRETGKLGELIRQWVPASAIRE